MLSFFAHPAVAPRACHRPRPEPSLAPLFRLLDDFDSYAASPRARPCARRSLSARPRPTPIFAPKFDVRETASTYELHGEFPGLQRDNVHIEFVDPQTLVIRGRVERTYESKPEQQEAAEPTTTPDITSEAAAAAVEPAQEQAQAPAEDNEEDTAVEVDWEDVKSTTSSASSSASKSNYHRATVEDDTEDEDGHSVVSTPKTVTSEAAAPKPATPAPEEEAPRTEAAAPTPAPTPASNDRFWLSERSVGEFQRAFYFAERVDQDGVAATLDNGVLNVTVPKAPQHVVRRVVIF